MGSSTHAPEVVPGQGKEVPFDGIEADRDDPYLVPDSGSANEKEQRQPLNGTVQSSRIPQSCWIIMACVAVIVIVGTVVGSVEGIRRHQLHRSVTNRAFM